MEKTYKITAVIENRIAVLNKITSAFLKRHVNIESLNTEKTTPEAITITIMAHVPQETMQRLAAQLGSMWDVISITCKEEK
ncbi:MAG: hypothetical protein FWE10_03725 [Rikenellaceae bacterium]|nr:hypothetical protein [Rikenellaceae bacterium]MCL2692668.1 hypothetical protein [Rikenellaceae bacterium]